MGPEPAPRSDPPRKYNGCPNAPRSSAPGFFSVGSKEPLAGGVAVRVVEGAVLASSRRYAGYSPRRVAWLVQRPTLEWAQLISAIAVSRRATWRRSRGSHPGGPLGCGDQPPR